MLSEFSPGDLVQVDPGAFKHLGRKKCYDLSLVTWEVEFVNYKRCWLKATLDSGIHYEHVENIWITLLFPSLK